MHEQSIVESLLNIALENAAKSKAAKIRSINFVVGELTGVVDDSIIFYFRFLSEKTIAAEAAINFKHMPAQLRCRACDIIYTPVNMDFRCPTCHEPQAEIIGGRELYVESLEVE
jgi:hydrogenase nickel incorporation protein HypA/HybF